MGRLFGTDGVRGIANTELTPHIAFAVGRAFAAHLAARDPAPRVLVGRDTRLSGPMLEGALTAGIASAGVDVYAAGVLPTAAIALLAQRIGAGGVAITASHNPAADNGIKLVGPDGFKLTPKAEESIERTVRQILAGEDTLPLPQGDAVGRIQPYGRAADMYTEALLALSAPDLAGYKVVLDLAHGAAVTVAADLFRRLGASVKTLYAQPDGLNINLHCGATSPGALAEAVVREGADVGFAFDGDADRVIAVDELGRVVDGDHIMAITALHLLAHDRLPERTIVATEYSNMGLQDAVQAAGGRVVTVTAGDRNVVEAMRRGGFTLGGEQSGHIVFLEHSTTGDGLLTALKLCELLQASGGPLSALRDQMRVYPQVLLNVAVRSKAWEGNAKITETLEAVRRELAGHGRLFIRASGTEPVIRILGEGRDATQVRRAVDAVAAAVREELGA